MKLKFLGTGTSQGIPVIGCNCKVCKSTNLQDKRLRSSVILTNVDNQKILIDCGPDFRQQMLNNEEQDVDWVLLTHEHNDHVIGLDDLRPIIFKQNKEMTIYCQSRVATEIKKRFYYAFSEKKYPGVPSFLIHEIENQEFTIQNQKIIPISVLHNKLEVLGFKFGNSAYITDASDINENEKEKLINLDVLIVNCLRKTDPHPAHFILEDVIKLQQELEPQKMFLTHISHQFGLHETEQNLLPKNMFLAYDGLEIDF